MSINTRFIFWLILILVSSGAFYSQLQSGIKIETNILQLLPKTEVDPFAEEAFNRFSDQNFKQIIIAIENSQQNKVLTAAHSLSNDLLESGVINSLNSQLSQEEQKKVGKLYFEHRFHLLSESDQKLLKTQGDEPFVEAVLQLVYSPISSQVIGLLPQDPYLLSYRYLQQASAKQSGSAQGQYIDGFLLYQDTNKYIILLSANLNTSPFDSATQKTLQHSLDQFKLQFPDTELLTTGAVFYAQHAAASAKSEISTIGLGSLIGVVLLLLIAFRSGLPLLMTLSSLAVGIFFAFTLVHLLFGSIHILTLVFGSSLVGVAVDYAFHYFASSNNNQNPLKHIISAITMGLISSVIGYIALYAAPFPGLQQMAVFCATGLIGAFLTVVLLFDRIPFKVNTPQWLLTVFQKQAIYSRPFAKPYFLVILAILPVISCYLLLNTDHNNDNIRQLQAIPPELYQQEQHIKELVSAPATNQFFVVKADSPESLLLTLDSVKPALKKLIDAKAIDNFTDITQFVPSAKTQQDNYQLIAKHINNSAFNQFLTLGLVTQAQLASLKNSLANKSADYLTLENWLPSPLGQRFSYLWLGKIDNQYASIITLHNIEDINQLEKVAAQTPELYFINKVDKVSTLFANYRELSLVMLLIAVLIIFLLLTLKYRLAIAGYIVLGPLIASSLSIIINIAVNGSFNLFSTLALFLVFGIGIDYGLFYAEAKQRSKYINLAIGLSAITTFLSFGLLSLSATPAIHAFGLTMLTGILTVFFLSPVLGYRIYQSKGLNNDSCGYYRCWTSWQLSRQLTNTTKIQGVSY